MWFTFLDLKYNHSLFGAHFRFSKGWQGFEELCWLSFCDNNLLLFFFFFLQGDVFRNQNRLLSQHRVQAQEKQRPHRARQTNQACQVPVIGLPRLTTGPRGARHSSLGCYGACGAGNGPKQKVPSQDVLAQKWPAKNHAMNHLLYPGSVLQNLLHWRPANQTPSETCKEYPSSEVVETKQRRKAEG